MQQIKLFIHYMKRRIIYLGMALIMTSLGFAQEKAFVLKGCIPGMKDGIDVAILANEDSSYDVIAETKVKNGCFELRGKVDHPFLCTLTTNNLGLIEKDSLSKDTIKWTYTPIFIDNVEMKLETTDYKYVPSDWSITPNFRIIGGNVQKDFNEYYQRLYEATNGNEQKIVEKDSEVIKTFILSHPKSVVSAYFANRILLRGYSLSNEQVSQLEKAIVAVPEDTARFSLFKERIKYAKETTVGSKLMNLEIADQNGITANLVDIIPQGEFVLVDFWASWCGQCLEAMPSIKELSDKYKNKLTVISVSCDRALKAWKSAMEKHDMPWAQYILTKQGYNDFFKKYRVGDGVPYFTLITPDGKVTKAPQNVEEIKEILSNYYK